MHHRRIRRAIVLVVALTLATGATTPAHAAKPAGKGGGKPAPSGPVTFRAPFASLDHR